jgi:hypothetical protein
MSLRVVAVTALLVLSAVPAPAQTVAHAGAPGAIEARVLSTNRTSTLEKEMNDAADAGYRFNAIMGGDTVFGGSEVVAVMSRGGSSDAQYAYKLLATSRTSTMQKEMQEAADAGFHYRDQTVFKSTFGGDEVVVILERNKGAEQPDYEYRLMATSRTATLQKELTDAGAAGYEVVGMAVGKTAIGGNEVVAITRRPRTR